MKKKHLICGMLALSLTVTPVLAAEIPRESAPENATEESIAITENLIRGILDEVQNGLGYQPAWCKAHNAVFNAVLAGNTSGYGYADLSAIARNAIVQYRDMYLRPEYYAEKKNTVKALIQDLIAEVQYGKKDYNTARDEAYIRIYQSVNPNYKPNTEIGVDRIYLDIPAVDSALFTVARQLLLEVL